MPEMRRFQHQLPGFHTSPTRCPPAVSLANPPTIHMPTSLSEIMDAVEPLSDGWYAYIHRRTGAVVAFNEDQRVVAESGKDPGPAVWMADSLPEIREALASEEFIQLPDRYDFNEFAVMQDFCRHALEPRLQQQTLEAAHGRGAFRRFKDLMIDAGQMDHWNRFRDQALREMIVDFLQEHGIPFEDA